LIKQGVPSANIVQLNYDSAAVLLDEMFKQDRTRCTELLSSGLKSFPSIERAFFVKEDIVFDNDRKNIGFYYLGRAGGFRQHAGGVPKLLDKTYNVITYSDEPPTDGECNKKYMLMSQESMLSNKDVDIAITTHFYPCSPPVTPKLTMMHMVYDFLINRKIVAEVIGQANTHYLFIPSVPSMELHKRICFESKLQNNVVLIPGGYPRHDRNAINFAREKKKYQRPNSIIYAPTLSSFFDSSESKYSYSILEAEFFIPKILKKFPTKRFIFRPHPEDLDFLNAGINTARAQAFRNIIAFCEQHPRCDIDDKKTDYIKSFVESAIMISDTSAIAFSFALTTKRPVIFFSPNQKELSKALPDIQYIKDRGKLGTCVENQEQLFTALEVYLNGGEHHFSTTHDCHDVIYNEGFSEQYLIDNFHYITENKRHPDWWYLRDHIHNEA